MTANLTLPKWVIFTMIGLCIALAFSLGLNILEWNTNKQQNARLDAIQNANNLASLAAHKTCVQTRPKSTELISDLAGYFSTQAKTLLPLLAETKKGTQIYATRLRSYHNYKAISDDLYSFLPIKCRVDTSG